MNPKPLERVEDDEYMRSIKAAVRDKLKDLSSDSVVLGMKDSDRYKMINSDSFRDFQKWGVEAESRMRKVALKERRLGVEGLLRGKWLRLKGGWAVEVQGALPEVGTRIVVVTDGEDCVVLVTKVLQSNLSNHICQVKRQK